MFRYNDYGYSPPRPSKKGGESWRRSGGGVSSETFRPKMQATAKAQTPPSSTCRDEPAGVVHTSQRGGVSADNWVVPVYNGGYNSLRPSKRGGEPWRRSGGGVSSKCFTPEIITTKSKQTTRAPVTSPSKPAGVTNPNPKPSRKAGAQFTLSICAVCGYVGRFM